MQTGEDIRILNEKIQHAAVFTDTLKNELAKIIIGQFDMIDRLMIALLSNGHILLEGVPGLAKTLTIKSLLVVIILAYLEKSLQVSRSAELRADDGCGCVRQPSVACL